MICWRYITLLTAICWDDVTAGLTRFLMQCWTSDLKSSPAALFGHLLVRDAGRDGVRAEDRAAASVAAGCEWKMLAFSKMTQKIWDLSQILLLLTLFNLWKEYGGKCRRAEARKKWRGKVNKKCWEEPAQQHLDHSFSKLNNDFHNKVKLRHKWIDFVIY